MEYPPAPPAVHEGSLGGRSDSRGAWYRLPGANSCSTAIGRHHRVQYLRGHKIKTDKQLKILETSHKQGIRGVRRKKFLVVDSPVIWSLCTIIRILEQALPDWKRQCCDLPAQFFLPVNVEADFYFIFFRCRHVAFRGCDDRWMDVTISFLFFSQSVQIPYASFPI